MKRFSTLVLVVISFISHVRSQVITITFEGTLNASPIPLDSILVMNLTAGGDTTIHFPDNMLVLGSSGLADAAAQLRVLRNQPNPFAGATDILVSTWNSGLTLLTVHDATGREVATYSNSLAAGQHRFRFTVATPGVHVLTVTQDGLRATHRMVAMTGDASGSSLTYAGGIGSSEMAKSDRSLFSWAQGDELRYIGYATDAGIAHSAAIDEVPTATATRTFDLFAGLACPESPTVTDIDGNVYRNVQIGGQCWMAENLRTTTYRDGTSIPNITDNTDWTLLSTGAWCSYDNDPVNDSIYGKLYNGFAANPDVCPQGWHVPTDTEWQLLEAELGMPEVELGQTGWRGAAENVGGKMKAITLWEEPNAGAINESGFTAYPSGFRNYSEGFFYLRGSVVSWWLASESIEENAWARDLFFDQEGIARYYGLKRNGVCIRCLRD